jgi:hypothetical protein
MPDSEPAVGYDPEARPGGAVEPVRWTPPALAPGPAAVASVFAAAATTAATGAALASRLLWPWASGGRREAPPPDRDPPSLSGWAGPGVHVSYTHIEIHWPTGR